MSVRMIASTIVFLNYMKYIYLHIFVNFIFDLYDIFGFHKAGLP